MTAFRINASYPDSEKYPLFDTDKMLDKIARKHKGENTGSGFGMGWRDIDYEFSTKSECDAFVAEVAETHPEIRLIDLED